LLAEVADRVGLTRELSRALAGVRERRGRHDPDRVIRDLCVMLADGGDCLSDLRAVRDQQPLFGPVASDSTAFWLIDQIAGEPEFLGALPAARARARDRAWELGARPERIVIDIDATLVNAHTADARTATGSQVAICCTSCRRGAGKPSATSTHLSDGQSRTQRVLDV
jgi:Transposase DDE domain group 1